MTKLERHQRRQSFSRRRLRSQRQSCERRTGKSRLSEMKGLAVLMRITPRLVNYTNLSAFRKRQRGICKILSRNLKSSRGKSLSLNARKKSKKHHYKETLTPESLKQCQKAPPTMRLRNKCFYARPRKPRRRHLMKSIARTRKLSKTS